MYEVVIKTFLAILETFIIFGIGAWLTRRKVLDENGISQISNLTLDVLFPLLTIGSITRNFKSSDLADLWILPVAGFAMMAAGMLMGLVFCKFMLNKSKARQAMFQHYCTSNNYLFLPLIVLDNLWGDYYVSLLLVMSLGGNVGFWTLGIASFGGNSMRETVRNIFSVNLYAVLLALTLVVLNIPLPGVVANICNTMGGAAVPLVLVGIGAAIYKNARGMWHNLFDVFYLSAVRLIILPLIFIMLFKLLPIPQEIFRVLVVTALMPVSSSSVLVARRYGGDMELASQAIVISTILSIVTVPLMLILIL